MKTKFIAIGLILVLVIGVWWGLGAVKTAKQNQVLPNPKAETSVNTGSTTQPLVDDQGGLQVGVIWNKQNLGSTVQTFEVELNNHAFDVESFDFIKNIQIKVDDKEITVKVNVLKKNGAGHHASTELSLESPEFAKLKTGSRLTLIIKNVFNTPTRTFTWTY